MSDTIGYGVIGGGMMGGEHILDLNHIDGAQVVALADPVSTSVDWGLGCIATGPGGEAARDRTAVYDDHRDLLGDPTVDVVVITSPNYTHAAVLATDKHVLIEKPLCTNVDDCKRVEEAAAGRDAITWMGLQYRFMPTPGAMLQQLETGVCGTTRMVAIREHRYPFRKKVGDWNRFSRNTGGTLVEKCCHFFDLMHLAAGAHPVRVMASGGQDVNHLDEEYDIDGRIERPDILDNALVVVEFANGVRGSLDLRKFAEGGRFEQELTITGDLAKMEATVLGDVVWLGERAAAGPPGSHPGGEVRAIPAPMDPRVPYPDFHQGASFHGAPGAGRRDPQRSAGCRDRHRGDVGGGHRSGSAPLDRRASTRRAVGVRSQLIPASAYAAGGGSGIVQMRAVPSVKNTSVSASNPPRRSCHQPNSIDDLTPLDQSITTMPSSTPISLYRPTPIDDVTRSGSGSPSRKRKLRCLERAAAGGAEGAHHLIVEQRAVGMGAVLDQHQIVATAELREARLGRSRLERRGGPSDRRSMGLRRLRRGSDGGGESTRARAGNSGAQRARIVELGHPTDTLGDVSTIELRERIIHAVRTFRPYALVSFDPYAMYAEDNLDHVTVARAVDESFWTSQFDLHHPEHFGEMSAHTLEPLAPHGCFERRARRPAPWRRRPRRVQDRRVRRHGTAARRARRAI